MRTAGIVLSILVIAATVPTAAQKLQSIHTPFMTAAPPALDPSLQQKLRSGELISRITKKISGARTHGVTEADTLVTVAIYASSAPTQAFLSDLAARGVQASPASWIPPLEHHPLGFFIARIPAARLADVLAIAEVKMMDTAEREAVPQNHLAAVAIKADLAWANSWTGTGVRVGVLDSGFDDRMPASELPAPVAKRDYGFYPAPSDTTVRNTVSAHGTHVVGTVLGRGGWSMANTINGAGSYQGMAPNADLVFLKIGRDATSSATEAAMVAAIKAAADTFFVKELNMSYGMWDTYHDGSDAISQAVDYAYSRGVACFLAAGNSGAEGHHVSGIVNAHDTSGYIPITVTAALSNSTYLDMNLVWTDSSARAGMTLLYYNAAKNPVQSSVATFAPSVSPRGTVSMYSYCNAYLPAGNSTQYLRVLNSSGSVQPFHIYFYAAFGNVVFAAADPNYTIASPALADHGFAVGAYTTRVDWAASNGFNYEFTGAGVASDIAPFSSRGPRIDGLRKPNIAAPGSAVISLRDRDVLTVSDASWIDNDGIAGGPANYYVMQGTSMASPVCVGAAALIYQHSPRATPQQIYDAITAAGAGDFYTGVLPNSAWGAGKLDVNGAINNSPLPVELVSFTAAAKGSVVMLSWKTAGEVNNYGFDIERRPVVRAAGRMAHTGAAGQLWTKVGFASGNGTTNVPRDYSFADRIGEPGAVTYRLKQIDRDGKFTYGPEVEVDPGTAPIEYSLGENFPNPFNPVTRLRFSIGKDEHVRVAVFDLLGRAVAELVNEPMRAGRYTVEWNGERSASGIYFCRINAGAYSAVRKLILQK